MISAFIGSPGSGKSTAAAWVALRATKRACAPIYVAGQCISSGHEKLITNFEFPGAFKLHWDMLGRSVLDDALIIIDEMSMFADSRDFKNFDKALKFFISQHRKSNIDILWLSQNYDDVDKRIRNLTTKYYLLTPLIFDFYKLTSIDHFTDICDYKITSGYDFGKSHIFWGRPIYKIFDSFALINPPSDVPAYPLDFWDRYGSDSEKSADLPETLAD